MRVAARKRKSLAIAISLVSAGAVAPPVMAQEGVLEEVIVTARKRAESLQETPVAVTALNAESLREAGVHNLSDLNQLAPSIDVSSGNGNSAAANIYIRGVGQRNTGVNIDSGVGIYLDDVYISRPDGALLDVNDIQSVQVLRGPQGTLFGKNTTGGALVFTTNRPMEEFDAAVGARVGNYNRLDANFMVNLPLTDSLYTRLSGVSIERDGYIENLFDGRDYMNEDRQSLIWQTRWVPDESLILDLNANWSDTDQLARPQKCILVPEFDGWQAALFDQLAIIPSTGRTTNDYCQDAAEAGDGDGNTVISDLGGRYVADTRGLSFTANWEINDNISFKSISAWRYTEASQDDELDHSGIPFLHRTQTFHPASSPRETDQYSQEFQFIGSAFDERMQWVAGAYWFREESRKGQDVTFLGPYDPAVANLFFLNSTSRFFDTDNDAVALFSQVEWEFNENWRTTLGVRYTDEKRALTRTRYLVDPATLDLNGGQAIAFGGGLYAVNRAGFEFNENFAFMEQDFTEDSIEDDDITPMASIQYLLDGGGFIDTGSLYLTYAEGFLSGGLSEAPSGELEEFLPEEVTNIEFGFKLDLMDRRLRLNGALFNSDYDNRQLTTLVINSDTSSPAPATINAAKSTIRGFELESMFFATRNLLLTFNMTLTDGDIEEFEDVQLTIATSDVPAPGCERADLTVLQVDSCPNDRSSENLPRLAEQSYFLAAQYTWESGFGQIIPRVQASLKKNIDYCFDAASCDSGRWLVDEQFQLDGRVSWISPSGRWVGSLFGNNLTEVEYGVGGTALVESQGVGGMAFSSPRMYGAEVQYQF